MRNDRQVVSLSSFVMAQLPRRVKLLPSASLLCPLLMALSMGSLCLGGYSFLFFFFQALASSPLS